MATQGVEVTVSKSKQRKRKEGKKTRQNYEKMTKRKMKEN
jgi:hypothetical protein